MWFVPPAFASEALLIAGDAAPPLAPRAWLEGGPVAPGAGTPLLVEFTASWCGPCEVFLPTLVAIAKERADALDVVSVHVFERTEDAAETFVATHRGEGIAPNVAFSGDGATEPEAAWMGAAGRDGLPSVFVVSADGRIAWIGYPEDGLSAVLDAVVQGTWDVDAERAATLRAARRRELQATWNPRLADARGRPLGLDARLAVLEEAASADPDTRDALASAWFEVLRARDPERAIAFAEAAAARPDAFAARALQEMSTALITDRRLAGHAAAALSLSEAANARYHGAHADLQLALAHARRANGDVSGAADACARAIAIEQDPAVREDTERACRRLGRP